MLKATTTSLIAAAALIAGQAALFTRAAHAEGRHHDGRSGYGGPRYGYSARAPERGHDRGRGNRDGAVAAGIAAIVGAVIVGSIIADRERADRRRHDRDDD